MPHIHETYDFVASAFVVYNNKVLFANHPRYGKWLPIGGHVELDEDPEETLLREIKEEAGLEVRLLGDRPELHTPGVKTLVTPHYMNVHEANPPHKHISLIYFVAAKSDKVVKSDEHTELLWLSDKDLDSPEYDLPPSLKFYARQAIRCAKNTT
jgi:8-oxo-dGTP pyrophosphatase MutT (NUDIX family)